eukprot:522479-Rhodomonas_salina.1
MKQGTSGTTPKTPGTPRDCERAPENSGEFRNQACEVIECHLCKKVGISLLASNHLVRNCKDAAQHIAKMSVQMHQPHGNPPSGKYVPPAGTMGPRVGFSNAAIAHTQSLGCAALAEVMFGTSARYAALVAGTDVTYMCRMQHWYYAALVAGTDVTYMCRIMEDLGFKQEEPT